MPDNTGCCPTDKEYCVPVVENDDLKFQYQINTDTADDDYAIMELNNEDIELLLLEGADNVAGTAPAATIRNYTSQDNLYFEKFRTGETEITCVFDQSLLSLETYIALDACFQLAVSIDDGVTSDLIFVSNCFKRVAASCFLTLISFRCLEDQFGFRYCNTDDFANMVRMPFYLTKAQPIDSDVVYVKSGGSPKLLSSSTLEEHEIVVDFMPKEMHYKLKFALASDQVSVNGDKYDGNIVKKDAYKIEWDDDTDCDAQATAKCYSEPFDARNTNCEDCEEVIIPNDEACKDEVEPKVDIEIDGDDTIITLTWTNAAGMPPGGYTVTPFTQLAPGNNAYGAPVNITSPLEMVITVPSSSTGTFGFRITAQCGGGDTFNTFITYTLP